MNFAMPFLYLASLPQTGHKHIEAAGSLHRFPFCHPPGTHFLEPGAEGEKGKQNYPSISPFSFCMLYVTQCRGTYKGKAHTTVLLQTFQ